MYVALFGYLRIHEVSDSINCNQELQVNRFILPSGVPIPIFVCPLIRLDSTYCYQIQILDKLLLVWYGEANGIGTCSPLRVVFEHFYNFFSTSVFISSYDVC